MQQENREKVTDKDLFTNLVFMLSSSAMQQLGKIVNPITGKAEVNLEGARITIDMIDMIQKKTDGNLDKDEKKMLGDILSSLHMTYVETVREQPEQAPETSDQNKPEQTNDQQKPEEEVTASENNKEKNPRFHKSYGESS